MRYCYRFLREEEGATTIEYCVVLCFIICACIAGITAVGSSNGGLWGKTSTRMGIYM